MLISTKHINGGSYQVQKYFKFSSFKIYEERVVLPFKKSIIITDKTKKRPITLQTFSFIDPFMFFYIRHRYINSKRLREAKDKLYIVVLISLSVDLLV